MKYSNKPLELLRALCVAAIFIFSVNACTEVDDRLGASLLPKNQRMKVRVDTLEGMQTFLYRGGGIASSRTGRGYIGKTQDAVFKNRSNSLVAQFLPSSYPTSLNSSTTYPNFGLDPIIDSVRIVLTIDSYHGDTTNVQSFEIFELRQDSEELSRDSTYYTDFPIDDYMNRAEDKLFDFTASGGTKIEQRLTPTAKGRAFLQRLISLDMKEEFINDTVFHDKFRGLYIAPTGGSPQDAAALAANLSESGFQLFMRIHDTLDTRAIYDTTFCSFLFRDTDDSSTGFAWNSVSVNMVEFDYAGSPLGDKEAQTNGFTDTLPGDATQDIIYIQSMGGVSGFLRFTDEMLDKLKNLQFEVDEVSGERIEHDILINQAMMYAWIDQGTDVVEALDNSITRLGSYTDLKSYTPIPDYMYSYEIQRQSQNKSQGSKSTYILPYNGYLNRSNAYYELDITAYVQQLAKLDTEAADAPDPAFKIAPDVLGMFGFGQSVLKGAGSDNPIKIRLTYTLIERPVAQ